MIWRRGARRLDPPSSLQSCRAGYAGLITCLRRTACRSRPSEDDIGEIAEALRAAKRVSAICHENPDADTIGAAVAVCIIAERLGAETEIVSADGIPDV